ncbi:MAG: glycosyltransferase family 4 protein [Alphaproteobacteria bacterium]|jgi:glycosyltransferase involved in cell wall biosynthesis|nr:MAG: glycosyltransferase family 4 protein [Alphaproteobacteria bacterium]
MRIAQISPLMEAVPPKFYGGTERIVAYLTDALVALGHEVTLFASGDSATTATLVAGCPRALRLDPTIRDHIAPLIAMLETVAQRSGEFDVIHLHCDYLGYVALRRAGIPFLATLHGRLDLPELRPLYRVFREVPVVSISDAQRGPLPEARYIATVQHGLPERLLMPGSGAGRYLAFLGRISPEKAPDRAIRIAALAGMRLKIAAKVDRVDREYFKEEIEPLLAQPHVEFIGEIAEHQKAEFLGNATGLVFPINWREPFGLAMIEAMACGTPVLAMGNGSVPEVVDEGVTGFIVADEAAAATAAQRLDVLDRVRIRKVFEERFTARRMAEDYVWLYRRLIADGETARAVI